MKVNGIKLEVEGESREIRDALPAILKSEAAPVAEPAAQALAAPAPALVAFEVPKAEPVDELHPDVVLEPLPADVVLPHERTAEEADAWVPSTDPPSPMPTRRFEVWEEIPADRRVWGRGCRTAHVLMDTQDPYSTFCGHDVGVANAGRRVASDARPCGNCNRRIEEAARA